MTCIYRNIRYMRVLWAMIERQRYCVWVWVWEIERERDVSECERAFSLPLPMQVCQSNDKTLILLAFSLFDYIKKQQIGWNDVQSNFFSLCLSFSHSLSLSSFHFDSTLFERFVISLCSAPSAPTDLLHWIILCTFVFE